MRDQLANTIMSNRAVDNWAEPLPSDFDLAGAIIAALPDMVQPLVWRETGAGFMAQASCGGLRYYINTKKGGIKAQLEVDAETYGPMHISFDESIDRLKAAAQADYTRRILSAFGITEGEM